MTIRSQKACLCLLTFAVLGSSRAHCAELRTWTFSQDGQMHTSADGTVSFRKKGRMDAAFIRLETNNLVLLATRAGFVTIASTNLSDTDRSYLARLTGTDELEGAKPEQNSLVRNEMARRRREAEKLRGDALDKRRLAQVELDAADNLEEQALRLVNRADNLEAQARQPAPEIAYTNSGMSSESGSSNMLFTTGTDIAAAAARQLKLDIAGLYQQAKEKRQKAAKLQKEAASLQQAAQSEQTNSVPCPTIAR